MDISSVTGASSPAEDRNDTSSQYSNACVYRMPIVGYEVLEERSRFTVFKIQIVHQVTGEQWFVFRRYTDFVRLNKKLKLAFPGLRFSLPSKKWFGDNFDPLFLEDRQIGLQAFIDNIIGHSKIRECQPVRKFFCLDYPPGPHDSLEESRAMCQSLEESIAELQEHLREKDGEISILRSHIHFLSAQQRTLVKALRLECEINEEGKHPPGSTHDLNCALLSICEKSLNGIGDMGSILSLERELTGDGRRPRSSSDNQITSPVRKILERVFLPGSSQTICGDASTGVSSMRRMSQSESNTNNIPRQQDSVEGHAPQRKSSLSTLAQGVAGYLNKTNSSLQGDSSKTSSLQSGQKNGLVRHKVCDGTDENCMVSSESNSNITNNNSTNSNGFLQVPTASR
ncbi:sorting nexin 16 isoform X2 [Oratosquilla oratoria]